MFKWLYSFGWVSLLIGAFTDVLLNESAKFNIWTLVGLNTFSVSLVPIAEKKN